jgi:iron(III) transport system substrate-binding protein
VHPQVKEKAGHKLLKDIKTLKDDPAGVAKQGEAVKARYVKLFKV